jgi:hypothetical protein
VRRFSINYASYLSSFFLSTGMWPGMPDKVATTHQPGAFASGTMPVEISWLSALGRFCRDQKD